MAIVKRSSASKADGPAKVKAAAETATPTVVLTLPDEPNEVSHDLNDYYVLLHGVPKVGKTSLAMEEGGVLLLTFDPLQKSVALLQRFCPTWQHTTTYLQMLEKRAAEGNYPYKRVVLDGVDMMYRLCQRWTETSLGVEHVSEEKWGRGWDKLKDTFTQIVDRFMALPGGCWFISHSEWREQESRFGRKIQKLMPTMKAAAEEIIVGKVDCWFAYDYNGTNRVLIVRGDEKTGAGCRIHNHFYTPDGRQVIEIPMGNSSAEAYANLANAFNNQQEFASLGEIAEGGVPAEETAEEVVEEVIEEAV